MAVSKIEKLIASNHKIKFEYNILNTWEAGVSLMPTEVKSIMSGNVNIKHAYATIEHGEVFILNLNIARCIYSIENHEPTRKRRLLLHRREINRMVRAQDKFHTLVPMQIYTNSRKKIKILIALCEGKTRIDKRKSIKEREMTRLSLKIKKRMN